MCVISLNLYSDYAATSKEIFILVSQIETFQSGKDRRYTNIELVSGKSYAVYETTDQIKNLIFKTHVK